MEGASVLVWGMLFGAIGLGFLVYGKRQREGIPLLVGAGLIIFPYFMPNVPVLLITGAVLLAVPYFVRI